MYRIFLTNFGWYLDETTDSFRAAVDVAARHGFEANIYCAGLYVGSWSPLYGARH